MKKRLLGHLDIEVSGQDAVVRMDTLPLIRRVLRDFDTYRWRKNWKYLKTVLALRSYGLKADTDFRLFKIRYANNATIEFVLAVRNCHCFLNAVVREPSKEPLPGGIRGFANHTRYTYILYSHSLKEPYNSLLFPSACGDTAYTVTVKDW